MGSNTSDKRMRDIELILRFLALLNQHEKYRKPMKEFISDFMAENKAAPQPRLEEFKTAFVSTAEAASQSLGRKPFHIRTGLNAAVFDSVMVAFGSNRGKVPSNIKDRYKALLDNEAYQTYVSTHTTDVDAVKGRIGLASRLLFRK